MILTIEQYIAQCFVMRKKTESDLVNIYARDMEHYIRIMQDEVADRMRFSETVSSFV